ncbi:DUF5372 family protein [Rhizobium jaguaris]|uniref:DUF5372 family protein n=1 Tax=Rhizobium jaguaris TaxID=1312183 RepID=UPI003CCB06F2
MTLAPNQASQTAPIVDGVVHHVTIIDPRHGLAGQRLELVSVQSGRGAAFVVVRLPDGRRRSIRRSATDLVAASPEARSESKSAPRISVRTLLTLMRHLNSMVTSRSKEVIRDERAIKTVPRSVSVPRKTSDPEHDSPASVARFAAGDAETSRSKTCPLLMRMRSIRAPTKVARHAESDE